jgi:hypothetical protein
LLFGVCRVLEEMLENKEEKGCYFRGGSSKQLATSCSPPTTIAASLNPAQTCRCLCARAEAAAGHALPLLMPWPRHLKPQQPAIPILSLPLFTTTTVSSSEQFTSITPPFPNSPRHHVCHSLATLLIPSTPPRAIPVARTPSSSLILTEMPP